MSTALLMFYRDTYDFSTIAANIASPDLFGFYGIALS
jgi:hypothetical protein